MGNEATAVVAAQAPIRLDLGAGKSKRGPEWTSVDVRKFEGVDVVADLTKRWPWEDNTVEEVNASHVLEHFDAIERVHFLNELYRVLKPGGKATIITPHWASCRAYGDFTHKWPPVSEMAWYYVSKQWRDGNAPHTDVEWNSDGYRCNFAASWGYSMRQDLLVRNQEYQQFALQNFKEAASDMICTLTRD